MKRLIEIADRLNELHDAEPLDTNKLTEMALALNQILDLRIKIIDFEKYNKDTLATPTEEKLKNVKEQNFDNATNLKEEEKKCSYFDNFHKYFKLKHSFFYPEENRLFCFYLGTSKQEREIKEFIIDNTSSGS
ncbi:hypothetical protein [Maribellus sp. YY47]|uniref:hypothetical protein n=1 Tax=Maribellus sp. YY47 TaxID=2929486 RepID=UPI0020013A6B|nr:hypothetical protein [Maribellus sp. YY47]MCK3684345.1 hypothetical protein [Maribellus sp. YY47]